MTAEKARPWIWLILGIMIIIYSLKHEGPALLMVGCSLLGLEPLGQARKEPPPLSQDQEKEKVLQ